MSHRHVDWLLTYQEVVPCLFLKELQRFTSIMQNVAVGGGEQSRNHLNRVTVPWFLQGSGHLPWGTDLGCRFAGSYKEKGGICMTTSFEQKAHIRLQNLSESIFKQELILIW